MRVPKPKRLRNNALVINKFTLPNGSSGKENKMGDFKIIETQEELDSIIEKRLSREREASNKRFEGYVSPEDHKKAIAEAIAKEKQALEDFKKAHEGDAKTIEELTAKNKSLETAELKSRVAHELGLSYDWISRIGGEDEESIRADAESLKKLVGAGQTVLPTKSTEETGVGDDAGYRTLINSIKKS